MPQTLLREKIPGRVVELLNAETVRDQQDRFSSRQVLQSLDDIVERAQGADGEHVLAQLVKLLHRRVSVSVAGTLLHGRESTDTAPAVRVPFHAVDGGVELPLVVGKLLQGADAAA